MRKRLIADDESGKHAGHRPATRATLVSLGVLRASELPLVGRIVRPARAAAPDRGSVAHSKALRATVVVAAFTAAILFLAAPVCSDRAISPLRCELVWSWSAAVAAIAVLVVAGVVVVPAFRGCAPRIGRSSSAPGRGPSDC